jgi:hypothetical protein
MIKLFRNIRQNLINEGKTTKYFKYAIGEIVLVVIGILIALQINNWNEKRKEAIAVKNVLLEIKDDLIQDKAELKFKIQERNEDFEAQKRIVSVLETKTELNNNVRSDLGRINLFRPVYSVSKGYGLLKELNLGLLNDKELRALLIRYYERDIPEVHQETTDDKYEFETFWLPYVRKYFIEWDFGNYAIPENYSQILNDKELLTAIKINLNNTNSTIEAYTLALNNAILLIEMIETEQAMNND